MDNAGVWHDVLERLDITQILLFVIPSLCGAWVLWYRKHFPVWKKFWRDVFEGLRGIPALQAEVKGIRYYVSPNGGGSMMDSITHTEKVMAALVEQIDLVVQTMRAENDSDGFVARFYADGAGANTYVNRTYARWLGVGKTELLGWNYFNFIHLEDVDRVRQHWDLCRSECRHYRIRYRVVTADGESIDVEAAATPIPENAQTKRWVGSIRRLDSDRRSQVE